MGRVINFLKLADPYGYMSNFYPCKIKCLGYEYPTSEHLYQSMKYLGRPHEATVRTARTAWIAAKLGRDTSQDMISNWDDIRVDVMRYAVLQKFLCNMGIRSLLIKTGDAVLIEHGHHDKFWADGGDGSGQNMLGVVLMETRSLFQNITTNVCQKHADSLLNVIRSSIM